MGMYSIKMPDIGEGIERAREAIDSGAARGKLAALRERAGRRSRA